MDRGRNSAGAGVRVNVNNTSLELLWLGLVTL